MAKFIDYYKILGVDKDTPQSEIRAAYRKRSKQFHPDLHPDDPKAKAKFQLLNEAYDVLKDPEKRKTYDTYGANWKNVGGGGPAGGNPFDGFGGAGGFDFSNINFGGGGGGFSDFFSELFGGGGAFGRSRQRASNPKIQDLHHTATIDIYTAILGGETIVNVGGSKYKLKVKEGTQQGTKVKIPGKGNTRPDGSRTDLIITYHISIPTNLTDRQKELLKEMR